MKTTIDILPAGSKSFNAGQAGKFFILREASQSIILRGDKLRPVELERGDVVDVSQFDELEIYNHNKTSVHVEYQVADVEVRIRTASTAINGALNINEVQSPITIDRIQEPLDIAVSIPDVQVNIPDVKATLPGEVTIGNFPSKQRVELANAKTQSLGMFSFTTDKLTQTITAKTARKMLIFQAPKTNQGDVLLGGFFNLPAGGVVGFEASNAFSIKGINGDSVTVGEVML
ncbi:hypothetical protein AB2S62_21720 [Vibrio sp. NTOU-M3]|uniref:hypothetical protein n=1 Tax=Vibrio sp. NTOU-M3 TaxID=3234954 RepID=UPI00349F31FE